MEFPTIDKFAKDVAEKALDEFIYEGKTIREWVEILVKQQPCEDCVSRDELRERFKWLEKATKYGNEDAEQQSFSYSTMMMYEIKDEIDNVIDSLPSVTPQQKWVLCSERLPEEGGAYLVTTKWKGSYSGDVYIETNMAVYREQRKEWDCVDVIAWMPLPEHYQSND